MLGIADMFRELDGYDRHEAAIEVWATNQRAERLENQRNYQRWYRKTIGRERYREYQTAHRRARYQTDAEYRAQVRAYVNAWRAAKRTATSPRPVAQHGTHSKYVGGCRCDLCRAASTRYRAERRAQSDAWKARAAELQRARRARLKEAA